MNQILFMSAHRVSIEGMPNRLPQSGCYSTALCSVSIVHVNKNFTAEYCNNNCNDNIAWP